MIFLYTWIIVVFLEAYLKEDHFYYVKVCAPLSLLLLSKKMFPSIVIWTHAIESIGGNLVSWSEFHHSGCSPSLPNKCALNASLGCLLGWNRVIAAALVSSCRTTLTQLYCLNGHCWFLVSLLLWGPFLFLMLVVNLYFSI